MAESAVDVQKKFLSDILTRVNPLGPVATPEVTGGLDKENTMRVLGQMLGGLEPSKFAVDPAIFSMSNLFGVTDFDKLVGTAATIQQHEEMQKQRAIERGLQMMQLADEISGGREARRVRADIPVKKMEIEEQRRNAALGLVGQGLETGVREEGATTRQQMSDKAAMDRLIKKHNLDIELAAVKGTDETSKAQRDIIGKLAGSIEAFVKADKEKQPMAADVIAMLAEEYKGITGKYPEHLQMPVDLDISGLGENLPKRVPLETFLTVRDMKKQLMLSDDQIYSYLVLSGKMRNDDPAKWTKEKMLGLLKGVLRPEKYEALSKQLPKSKKGNM